jgi:hypothetical protein
MEYVAKHIDLSICLLEIIVIGGEKCAILALKNDFDVLDLGVKLGIKKATPYGGNGLLSWVGCRIRG